MKDNYENIKNDTIVSEANKQKTLFEEQLQSQVEPLANTLFGDRITNIKSTLDNTIFKESLLVRRELII